jgi:hypothetical protein
MGRKTPGTNADAGSPSGREVTKPEKLSAIIELVRADLDKAATVVEVLDAQERAEGAYTAAKHAARFAKFKDAVAALRRVQFDALMLGIQAQCRIADEYDAGQASGSVAGHGGNRGNQFAKVGGSNLATLAEIGLTKDQIFQARRVRDFEAENPGALRVVLETLLKAGEEPTKAAILKAIPPKKPTEQPEPPAPAPPDNPPPPAASGNGTMPGYKPNGGHGPPPTPEPAPAPQPDATVPPATEPDTKAPKAGDASAATGFEPSEVELNNLRVRWKKGRNYFGTFFTELEQIQKKFNDDKAFEHWCFDKLRLGVSILTDCARLLNKTDAARVKEDLARAREVERKQKAAERAISAGVGTEADNKLIRRFNRFWADWIDDADAHTFTPEGKKWMIRQLYEASRAITATANDMALEFEAEAKGPTDSPSADQDDKGQGSQDK